MLPVAPGAIYILWALDDSNPIKPCLPSYRRLVISLAEGLCPHVVRIYKKIMIFVINLINLNSDKTPVQHRCFAFLDIMACKTIMSETQDYFRL